MGNKVCCGFEHRDMNRDFSRALYAEIERQAAENGVTTFMTGGMGEFDRELAAAVRLCQRAYPTLRLILVKPYFSSELNTNKNYYESMFDEVIIPDVSATAYPKAAITKRNRWLVEKSDVVIAGIYRNNGGAAAAVKYARNLQKPICFLFPDAAF